MKRVGALILNRNLPQLTDELGDWMMATAPNLVDVHGIENGSDPDKYSCYARIAFRKSLGMARGTNEAIKRLLKEGYEFIWFNCNDTRYVNENFLPWAIDIFDRHSQVGMVTGWWPGNIWPYGRGEDFTVISLVSALGFIIRRQALGACAAWASIPLDPLWDSSNYTCHGNICATTLALAESRWLQVADQAYAMYEKREIADAASELARGASDEKWKHEIGPRETQEWIARAWPQVQGGLDELRAHVIPRINAAYRQYHPEIQAERPSWRVRLGSLIAADRGIESK